jgi:hypothetical protein
MDVKLACILIGDSIDDIFTINDVCGEPGISSKLKYSKDTLTKMKALVNEAFDIVIDNTEEK